MNTPVKVLIVEDSEVDATLAIRALSRGGFAPTFHRVQSAAELKAALAQESWDAVISDFAMPGFSGLDALSIFRSTELDIPFILMSGSIGEKTAVDAMRAGAHDYIMKGSPERLVPALERELKETQKRAAHRQVQLDLVESERRFSNLLGNVQLISVMLDREARITYCNDYLLRITGWQRTEVIGRDWFDLFMPAELGNMKPFFTELISNLPQAWHREQEIFTRSRERRLIRWNNSILRSGAGDVIGTASIGEDITEQKQAEIRIKRLNRVYAVLSGINTLIVRVRDCRELFDEACRIAVEIGGFGIAWIGLFDPVTDDITPTAWAGISSTVTSTRRSSRADIPEGQGLAARAVREKTAVFDNDIAERPNIGGSGRQEALRRGYGSLIALPLLVDGAVLGTLALFAKERDFFDAEELTLLTELAGDIAFAIDHIKRREKLEKLSRIRAVSSEINAAIVRISEREALLKEVCRIAADHGKFELVWVASLDVETQEIRPVAWTGFSPEIAHAVNWTSLSDGMETLGEVIQTRRPAVCDDIETAKAADVLRLAAMRQGCHSTVCLPLLVDDKVVAVIILFAPERDFFDTNELALLNEMVADLSFALQSIARREQLDYLAYYDALTGLANRSLFLERVAQYMRSAASGGHKLALGLLDLERFKNINDSLGRPAGDALLKQVAKWLTRNVGDASFLARVGADQFAVVLPEVKSDGNVARLVEKTLDAFVEHPFRMSDAVFRIAIKAGIALFPDDGVDADTLFRNAEAALKKAKVRGDRYLFYTQKMTEAVAGKLTLENQLRQALEKEEFVLHYQPKVNLASGKLTSAEALIRWNDPHSGLVPPGRFIPILEETGLINEVGRWALRQAIADYLRWRNAGLPAVRIAVNVSPLQLRNRGFVAEIGRVIGIDAKAAAGLELEITESVIMDDVKHNIASLQAIRDMGITIAIDDFGTGFSSLSYLAKLPVDTLKIDRSFVIDMTAASAGLALVSTIINLAHSMDLKVVAEGVETEEQSRLLHLLTCDEMQGYLFSKPVPGDIFESKFLSTPFGGAPGFAPKARS